jgi:hypothetical protein
MIKHIVKKNTEYQIYLNRSPSECIASIPELLIRVVGVSPEDALQKAIAAERSAKEALLRDDGDVPPAAKQMLENLIIVVNFKKYTSLLKKTLFCYVICLLITTILAVAIFNTLQIKLNQYSANKDIKAEVRMALEKVGLNACLEDR